MNVLLVRPNIVTFRGTTAPPLALLFVGTYAKSKGHDVTIVDRTTDLFSYGKIAERRPDVVGITTMTGAMLLDAIEVSRAVKKRWGDGTKVVWGGVHASLVPEQTVMNDYVDFVVMGEGEVTFHELLQALESGTGFSGIKGLAYKEAGRCVINPRREFIQDLDTLPPIDWSLVDTRKYFGSEVTLVTSRGCPYDCAFCYNRKFNARQWRGWSADRTLSEIDAAFALASNRRLKFYDDSFSSNRKRFLDILRRLDKRASLWMEVRVDSIDEEVLELLAQFKKVWLFFGIESGDPDTLQKMEKRLSPETVRRQFRLFKRYPNIDTTASVVVGCPGETADQVRATIAFLKEINPTRHLVQIYFPVPGSRFFDEYVASGKLKVPATTEGWARTMNGATTGFKISYVDDAIQNELRRFHWWSSVKTVSNYVLTGNVSALLAKTKDYKPFVNMALNGVDRLIHCR